MKKKKEQEEELISKKKYLVKNQKNLKSQKREKHRDPIVAEKQKKRNFHILVFSLVRLT